MVNVLVKPLKSNHFMGSMWIISHLSGYKGEIDKSIINRVYRGDRKIIRPDMFCPRLRQASTSFHLLDRKEKIDMNSAIIISDSVLSTRDDRYLNQIKDSVSDLIPVRTAQKLKGAELTRYEDQVIASMKSLMSISELLLMSK